MQPTPPRDFSSKKTEGVPFTADGDSFMGVPRVATMLLANTVAAVNDTKNMTDKLAAVSGFFDVVLEDESAVRFKARLSDKKNPIDLEQAMEIIDYLVEQYANGRPTQPSESSSDGSPTEATGTSSTAGVPSEVSIQVTSPLNAS